MISQFLYNLMMPLMGFIGNLSYVAVISFGVIVAFMVYIRLFTQPLSQLAQAFQNMQRTASASERVFEFFDEAELDDETKKEGLISKAKGNVEFINVNFGYSNNRMIINNFSTTVKAGKKVAIVGPTGAGKTTVVNLLMRFYEVYSGKIIIDGTDINQTTRENVHDQFCMVLQDTLLFEGTVKENIIYSKKNVTDEEVISACKAVGVHHFIKTLPNVYYTVLNERVGLSQGQKQLLTIARAIIKDATMLILD